MSRRVLAFTWLEVAWSLLLTIGSSAIWLQAEVQVKSRLESVRDDSVLQEFKRLTLQQLLDRDNAELEVLSAALAKERVALEKVRSHAEALLQHYPEIEAGRKGHSIAHPKKVSEGKPKQGLKINPMDLPGEGSVPEEIQRINRQIQLELETQQQVLKNLEALWHSSAERVAFRAEEISKAERAATETVKRAQHSSHTEARHRTFLLATMSIGVFGLAVGILLASSWNRHSRRVRSRYVFFPSTVLFLILVLFRELGGLSIILVIALAYLTLAAIMRTESLRGNGKHRITK